MSIKNQLLDISLSQFAQDGYEGASLSKIAAEAGIKKPSIYAHFKSKEDLFMKVYSRAARVQEHSIIRYMLDHHRQPLDQQLYGLLVHLQELYGNDATIKFVMRMAFFPPRLLEAQVAQRTYRMLDTLEQLLLERFEYHMDQQQLTLAVPADEAAKAYMIITDGILLDMLYGQSERSIKRMQVMWPIYWRGITADDTDEIGMSQLE